MSSASELSDLAHEPVAARRLRDLALDADDTAVTLAAATALVELGDELCLGILASALHDANDQQLNWIETGIGEGLRVSECARERALDVAVRMPLNADRRSQAAVLLAELIRTAGRG